VKRKVLAILLKFSLEKLAVKHDPVYPVDDAGRLGIIRLKYLLIPIQIEDRAGSIKGKVENLDVVDFKISGMNPVGGMGCAHDDDIGLDPGVKGFAILKRKMRVDLFVHPKIHQEQDDEQKEHEEKNFSIGDDHLPFPLELKINEGLIIILTEEDKKQDANIIDGPSGPDRSA
jgi:hypothetical protein